MTTFVVQTNGLFFTRVLIFVSVLNLTSKHYSLFIVSVVYWVVSCFNSFLLMFVLFISGNPSCYRLSPSPQTLIQMMPTDGVLLQETILAISLPLYSHCSLQPLCTHYSDPEKGHWNNRNSHVVLQLQLPFVDTGRNSDFVCSQAIIITVTVFLCSCLEYHKMLLPWLGLFLDSFSPFMWLWWVEMDFR